MVKIYEKTGVKCPVCNAELILVEDIVTTEIDEEIFKDVEHYFECPNRCDFDDDDIPGHDKEIDRIIDEQNEE